MGIKKLLVKTASVIISILAIGFITLSPVGAYYTNMPATLVLGQPDFVSNSKNQCNCNTPAANTFNFPYQMIMVGSKLVVTDENNNRLLIYNSIPTTNNASPNIVIGQADFTHASANQGNVNPSANTLKTPTDISTDGVKLFVADDSNNRILIYNQVPTSNNASADVVIGQADFTHGSANQGGGSPGANTLNGPTGVYYDAPTGRLFIADPQNHRVLIYNQVPTSNNASADVVIGQADFTHGSVNQGGAVGPNTLQFPQSMRVLNGNKLVVADGDNNRLLIWNSIPTSNNSSADVVIGQADFTHNSANQGGSVAANTLFAGYYFTFINNRLVVSDAGNSRILIYNTIPAQNNVSADMVIGQADFTHGSANQGGSTSSNTLNLPIGVFATPDNRLMVADRSNHRILIYPNTTITPQINLTTPPVGIGNGRYRLTGNVFMNNNGGTYALQTLQADLNGTGYGSVNFAGGRSDGSGNSIYDFTYDFDPTVGLGSINNLTIKFLASTFNADTNTLFYFLPFKFTSFNVSSTKSQNFTFSVNKDQLSRVKDNLDHFEVWYKPNTTTGKWTQYISNIPDTQIDNAGNVVATKTTNNIKFIGSYIFKIQAIDNWGNRQDSNYLYTSGYNPITLLTSYPSFGKKFVTLPTPIVTPVPVGTTVPTYSPTPYVVPTQMPVQSQNPGQDNTKLYFVILAIIPILLIIILLLRRRRRKN